MINKYQQGGSVIQQLQQLPKELQEQIMQAFALWAQEKGIDIQQIQQDTNSLEQALVQFIQETQQQLVQAAKHGAKLKYIKSLKNVCEEDEEPYYYKKGGSLGCGCVKKKMEEGGQTSNNPVDKFKEIRKALSGTKNYTKDLLAGREPVKVVNGVKYFLNGDGQVVKDPKGKGSAKPGDKNWKTVELTYDEKTGKMRPATPAEIALRRKNNQDAYKGKGEGTPQRKKGGELKKNCGGSTLKLKKKGGEVCPKCGKVHAAGMGCAIAKFKMHQLGGNLNEILSVVPLPNPNIVKYNPMIHGISRTKSKSQLINNYKARLYNQQSNNETNGQVILRKAGEVVGNIAAPIRVPIKAAYNWLISPSGTNTKNLQAYNNRNKNSYDIGERFLGLKHGGNI